jgi:chromosomal replication initiation ATPase DnaA
MKNDKTETKQGQQLVLDLPVETAMGEADFVVGAGNKNAYDHFLVANEWPAQVSVLFGPPKSGKTHLAGIWAKHMGALSIEKNDEWPDYLESDLLVEHADLLWMGETALFNLLNQAMRSEFRVVLTASLHPNEWALQTNDVRSRLRLAHSVEIAALDDAHLMHLFVKLFDDRQVQVEPSLIGYILPRMERSPAQVVALVEKMDELALSRGKAITKRVAAEALEELARD